MFYIHNQNQSKTKLLKLRNSVFALMLLFTLSCAGDNPYFFQDDFSDVPAAFSTVGITPDTTETGLIVYTLAEGNAQIEVGRRDIVKVFYTGRKTNGEIFDSSFKNGQTTASQFTVANVIDGFTEGLLGMKEGGKKVLVIPPNLAYEGTTNTLREDTLVFDIELETIIF